MTEIIKTGMYIEGVEVTSEHIGRKVILDKDVYDLDSGAENIIEDVGDQPPLKVRSLNGYDCCWDCFDTDDFEIISRWKWADRSIVEGQDKSIEVEEDSLVKRKVLADSIRNVEKELKKAIANAEECGMMVSGLNEITIEYHPPMEEY